MTGKHSALVPYTRARLHREFPGMLPNLARGEQCMLGYTGVMLLERTAMPAVEGTVGVSDIGFGITMIAHPSTFLPSLELKAADGFRCRECDQGIVFVTNRRILFVGIDEPAAWRYNRVICFNFADNLLVISIPRGNQRCLAFEDAEPVREIERYLTYLLNKRQRQLSYEKISDDRQPRRRISP